MDTKDVDPRSDGAREQDLRDKISTMLWEKQFEGTPWANKIHLIAPRSLEPYREFADKLINAVRRA